MKPAAHRISIGTGLLTAAVCLLAVQLSHWTAPSASAPVEGPAPALRAFGAVHPRLAPDGKSAVLSYQGGIWRLEIEKGVLRRLAGGVGFAVEPCWSPDGRRVAFLQSRGWGGGQVKLIDALTGAAVALPKPVVGTGKLSFSADGGRLLGHLRTGPQLEALRSFDLRTGELQTLVRHKTPRAIPWALSTDGKWVAFATTMDQPEQQTGNDGPQADLWKVGLDGGEPERLVRFPARIHDLCWGAGDRTMLVTSDLGGVHYDLWRVDLAQPGRPRKITGGHADEDRPSLSRDGRWLLHTDNQEGCTALVLRDLGTGDARTLSVQRFDWAVPTARLRLKVRDRNTNQPIVARVALEEKDGGFYGVPGSLWRVYRDHAHFHVSNSVELEVPAGAYRLRAFHGPEYRKALLEFDLKPGAAVEQTVTLERWADANARGWYSGDNHIHANYGYGEYYNTPATMAEMCAGEGLNVCNFMVANSDGDGVFDREFFRGRPDPFSTPSTLLYWNEEFRSTIWGHLTLVNLKQVVEPIFTGFQDTTNPHDVPSMAEISDRTRRQGGIVNYTHPSARIDDLYRGAYTAKGLPIYAALGKIDTMDVMGSNDLASTALYHRLLNCGFRLTASAGTDCFLNRIRSRLPGGQRVCVRCEGPLTYEKWMAGLKAGRSFVTNGPILELSANGKGLGETIEFDRGPAPLRVQGRVSTPHPLDRIEVLFNGKAAARLKQTRDGLTTAFDQTIPVGESGWLALRVLGPAQPDVEGEAIHAHTSPIYIRVAGKPAGSVEDARYFLSWTDRLWETVQERDRIPGADLKAQVQAEVDRAREIYRQIIKQQTAKGE